jgi:hypothetical protein
VSASSTEPDQARPASRLSRRRLRWLLVVLAAVSLVACCAVPVGVWLVVGTLHASKGGESPGAAVQGALGGLDRWAGDDLDGVGRYLSSAHFEELRDRLKQIRQQFLNDDPTYTVVARDFREVVDGRRATVTVDISLRWDMTGGPGTLFGMGESRPWVFRTVLGRFGSGWKVDGFDTPVMCDVYVHC